MLCYDLLGHVVARYDLGPVGPGRQSAVGAELRVSSGTYVLVMRIGGGGREKNRHSGAITDEAHLVASDRTQASLATSP